MHSREVNFIRIKHRSPYKSGRTLPLFRFVDSLVVFNDECFVILAVLWFVWSDFRERGKINHLQKLQDISVSFSLTTDNHSNTRRTSAERHTNTPLKGQFTQTSHDRIEKYFGSQWLPSSVCLFPTFFKVSSFVLIRRKNLLRIS